MRQLAGRTALVTGASSGLGPEIVRRLARERVRFVLSTRRIPELEALAAEVGEARVVAADLTRPGEAERLAALNNPYPIYEGMRSAAPVYRDRRSSAAC